MSMWFGERAATARPSRVIALIAAIIAFVALSGWIINSGSHYERAHMQPTPSPTLHAGSCSKTAGCGPNQGSQLIFIPKVALSPIGEVNCMAIDYVVQPGDTLWNLSIQTYGTPLRWRDFSLIGGDQTLHPIPNQRKLVPGMHITDQSYS